MKFHTDSALHEARLLSSRLKRTRTDYEKTSLHKFDKTVVQAEMLFSILSQAIKKLESFEAKLIDISCDESEKLTQ